MWDPDEQPVHSFEQLARQVGLSRARLYWKFLEERYRQKLITGKAIESCLAAEAAKRGEYVWNEELDGYPVARFAMSTYVDLYRASKHERGCSGGELLNDEDFMKFYLKRNEQSAIKVKSPHIREGWTEAIENAAWQGRQDRAARVQERGGVVADAVEAAAA